MGEHIGGGKRARPGKVFLAGFPHQIQGGTIYWENLILAHCAENVIPTCITIKELTIRRY